MSRARGFAAYLVRRISPQPYASVPLEILSCAVPAFRPPRREIPEVSFLTWLRQIQCEAFEIAE